MRERNARFINMEPTPAPSSAPSSPSPRGVWVASSVHSYVLRIAVSLACDFQSSTFSRACCFSSSRFSAASCFACSVTSSFFSSANSFTRAVK
ncbi:hypothetical protein HMI51_04480 [Corallococcus coralloides]|nr:hypothetical protein [Corallococcus coralloides]